MKKQYKKPLVAVEYFSIAQSTARDCMDSIPQDQVNLSDYPCGWEIGEGTIVFMADSTCNMDGDFFGVCYNNPGEGQYIFRS